MNISDLRIVNIGILIPFLGTTLGAAMVFFFKKDTMNVGVQKFYQDLQQA